MKINSLLSQTRQLRSKCLGANGPANIIKLKLNTLKKCGTWAPPTFRAQSLHTLATECVHGFQ